MVIDFCRNLTTQVNIQQLDMEIVGYYKYSSNVGGYKYKFSSITNCNIAC